MTAPFLRIPPQRLDELGRCCGRKPRPYKRPSPHAICLRCCCEYTPSGEQRANFAWRSAGDGFVSAYPDHGRHDYIEAIKKRLGLAT